VGFRQMKELRVWSQAERLALQAVEI